MMRAIQVKYSCKMCGIHRRVVTVLGRESEDVKQWMDQKCIPTVAADHWTVSPDCRSEKLDELMIPLFEDAENIGQPGDIPAKPESVEELKREIDRA